MSEHRTQAPRHPIEIRIVIGANDQEYLLWALDEMKKNAQRGTLFNSAGGGGGGSYSVTRFDRDITPSAYEAELQAWFESLREAEVS